MFDILKLLFRKDKELYSSLHNILGFYPRNIELYSCALAHRSLGFKGKDGHIRNNERLEFLGDAIIEAAVSDIVYRHFPNKDEGFLTNTRSKLVQRETLGKISAELGLDRLLRASGRMGGHNNYLGGNAFEAIVGAIYLDRGYHCAYHFIESRILTKHINIDKVAKREVNFKSKVLEWAQRNRLQIDFRVSDTLKPGTDAPVFTSQVVLEGVTTGQGTGYSKKESQQNAARDTLRLLQKQSIVDSILEAKQKRTAMEADLVSAPPRPDQIESEVPAERRRPAAADNAAKPRRQRKPKADNAAKPAGKQTARPAENKAAPQTADAAGTAEELAPKKRSRRRRAAAAREKKQDDAQATATPAKQSAPEAPAAPTASSDAAPKAPAPAPQPQPAPAPQPAAAPQAPSQGDE